MGRSFHLPFSQARAHTHVAPGPPATPVNAADRQPVWARCVAYGTDLLFKFMNDLTMNLVSMIAYCVLTSFVSLLLAVMVVVAMLPGATNRVDGLAAQINRILPADVGK